MGCNAVKTFTDETLPADAHYLGTANGDGTIYECLADAIERAIEPVRVRHDDGVFSYFDLQGYAE